MRLFFIALCISILSLSTNAQVKTPAASTACKVEQTVGLTDIMLEYSRPSVKGRTIFGDLVPYDKKWRAGANKNTMITVSESVNFGGTDVEAGTYALFFLPGKAEWTAYLYKNTENWGVPEEWKEDEVAATIKVKPAMNSCPVETMMYFIDDVTANSASLTLTWADLKVAIPMTFDTDSQVQATIDAVMDGPSGNDYYSAARYYRESGKNLDTALEWMDKSIEMRGEKYWMLRQKALILADKGEYKKATEAANRSLVLAKEAGSDGYVKMNEASIAEWAKM